MAERHAAAPHAAVRGGDAGGLAAGDASRATGTSVATVTTSLAAVELCDEDVAMRCSAQSDAGSAADPEWEAVLAQLLAEEAEEEELCCRFERRGDDSDDGWDNYSEEEEEEEDGHAAVQGVAGKVDESLERRDERACATGGGFSMPQAAPTSMGYHSCDCIEEGFNIQQTGIEGDRMSASDVSSVPIVTNQSHPSSQISACTDPESSAAPSRARRASAASTSAFNLNVPPPCARAF